MITTYYKNCVAGNVFGSKTTPPLPSAYYIGLSRTSPSVDGTNVSEPGDGVGYSRVQLNGLSEPKDGVVNNTYDITFDESTGSWGTVSYYVVYDQMSGGNLLMYNELAAPREIEAASIMLIKSGSLSLKITPIGE